MKRTSFRRSFLASVAEESLVLDTPVKGDRSISELEDTTQWASEWLDSVADGSNTMSQRKLPSVEERGSGLDAVKTLAKQKGVHLFLYSWSRTTRETNSLRRVPSRLR